MSEPNDESPKSAPIVPSTAEREQKPLAPKADEPPVVARLVIEIRSDGTRTIARGALEDQLNGERVSLEAEGSSPQALAASLVQTLLTKPFLGTGGARHIAKQALRALLPGRKK